jgi:hypothetical protein
MKRIFLWPAANDAGQELLDSIVQPLAARLNAQLELPKPGEDRRRMVKAIRECDAVICDGSVEEGHIYHKMVELVKVNQHIALCSRTPLPRNMYAFHQCAPTHGKLFSNAVLGQWLAEKVPLILEKGHGSLGYFKRMSATLADQQVRMAQQVGLFASYRGRLYEKVLAKAEAAAASHELNFRVVPKGELVYETECMTRQQTWSTVASIEREIHWAKGLMAVRSWDYFDSFWTTSELLIAFFLRTGGRGRTIENAFLIEEDELDLAEIAVPPRSFGNAVPTKEDWREYKRLLLQGDPGVVAPELERGFQGIAGLIVKGLMYLSGHSKAPKGDFWWSEVLVPCPHCGPKGRKAEEVNWTEHLRLEGYGYFAIPRALLSDGQRVPCSCPRCGRSLWLENRHPPRHIWIPGPLGQPWPETMSVLSGEPIWEVVA